MLKDLNKVSPSDDWFPYEYIDDEVNNKSYKIKGRLAGDEMEKETKHYIVSLNQYPNWLNTITIEIDNFLINCEYIECFIQMYMQWIKEGISTSFFQKLIITRLPCLKKLSLSQFH